MSFSNILSRLLGMTLFFFLVLTACSPVPPEDAGDVAGIDYDVFVPDDIARSGVLDLPTLPEDAEDCNNNKIDDAYDWAGYIPRGPYSVGEEPFDIVVGNLNSSARLELVVLNQAGGTASVLAQSRERRFMSMAKPDVGSAPACLTLADLNEDGVQDIVVGHETSAVSAVTVLINLGDGNEFGRVDHPVSEDPYLNRNPMCVGAAALRGAGPDILASSGEAGTGDVNRMMTLFDESDLSSPEHLRTSTMQDPGKFVIADFDNDGDNDFCTLSTRAHKVTCVKNPTGSARDTNLEDWQFFYFDARVTGSALVATDINDDALPELVIASNEGLSVYMNTGEFDGYCDEESASGHCMSMVFNLFEVPLGPFDVGGPVKGLAAADLDSDRDNDLVLSVPGANKVVFVANSGGSIVNLRGELRKRDLPVYDSPQGVLTGDIDGDGRIEVVVSNRHSNDIWVLHRRETPVSMILDCPLPVRAIPRTPPT